MVFAVTFKASAWPVSSRLERLVEETWTPRKGVA